MLKLYFRAMWAWMRALLKPIDLVEDWCSRGHSVLLGWEFCPDCRWLDRVDQHRQQRESYPAKCLLYCYKGPHQSELIVLRGHEESIGTTPNQSRVITCDSSKNSERIKVLLVEKNIFLSETKQSFQVNGVDTWKENIYDYDEIEMFGNHFLVLDLQPYIGFPLTGLQGGLG
jgi:hypothetical protein